MICARSYLNGGDSTFLLIVRLFHFRVESLDAFPFDGISQKFVIRHHRGVGAFGANTELISRIIGV